MSKNLVTKSIVGSLVISTVVTNSKVDAHADATAVLEVANEVSMACPYLAPLMITGAAVITTATTIIGIRSDKKTNEDILYKSYTTLPDQWHADTWIEKLNPNGRVIQRRYYGSDGLPLVDYDLSHHGFPDDHPKNFGGCHKHLFNHNARRPKDRRQKGIPMTEEEYNKYIKNFKEKAERMKVKYIED